MFNVEILENRKIIQFFEFQLDKNNLRKIMDLYAYLVICELIVILLVDFFISKQNLILESGRSFSLFWITSVIFLICGTLFYRFRYSLYTHAIVSLSFVWVIFDGIRVLEKLYDPELNLAKKLINVQFHPAYVSIYDYFSELQIACVEILIPALFEGIIFLYFAICYKKLSR
jgi:hypothetical protein